MGLTEVSGELREKWRKEKEYDLILLEKARIYKSRSTERNKRIVSAYKGVGCSVCGYDVCLKALEFHHLEPSKKKFAISRHGAMSAKKLIEEMEKCILLCANCHVEEHEKMKSVS